MIFLGTPDFAVNSLQQLIKSKHNVLAVVTQPDKPIGRSGKLCFSPVKQVALKNNIPVLQYEKISREGTSALTALKPDIMVTCAFGQILSQQIIDIAPYGIINVHASLLPKYRGAAPIQWSVINGDKITGVTIMQTTAGIDCGDILNVRKTEIGDEETSGELFERLSVIGAELLIETLNKIEEGNVIPVKQNEQLASHVKMLKKEDGIIDFNDCSENIVNFVRGMNPWPCAYTFIDEKILKVFKAQQIKAENLCERLEMPGTVLKADNKNGLIIATKNGAVRLNEIQPESKRRMSDCDYLLGHSIQVGQKLG